MVMEPLTQSEERIKTTLPAFGGNRGVDAYQKAMIEMGKSLGGNFGINVAKGNDLKKYHRQMIKAKMMKLFRDLGVAGAKNIIVKDQTTEVTGTNSNDAEQIASRTRSRQTQAESESSEQEDQTVIIQDETEKLLKLNETGQLTLATATTKIQQKIGPIC